MDATFYTLVIALARYKYSMSTAGLSVFLYISENYKIIITNNNNNNNNNNNTIR